MVELKASALNPEHAGQLNFYLSSLDAQVGLHPRLLAVEHRPHIQGPLQIPEGCLDPAEDHVGPPDLLGIFMAQGCSSSQPSNPSNSSSSSPRYGKPASIPVDKGMDTPNLHPAFIQPGRRRTKNCCIESFDGGLRVECMDVEVLRRMAEVHEKLAAWRLRDSRADRPSGHYYTAMKGHLRLIRSWERPVKYQQ